MAVPETSPDFDDQSMASQYDIRPTRKVWDMEPKPKSHRMQRSPNPQFRFGIN